MYFPNPNTVCPYRFLTLSFPSGESTFAQQPPPLPFYYERAAPIRVSARGAPFGPLVSHPVRPCDVALIARRVRKMGKRDPDEDETAFPRGGGGGVGNNFDGDTPGANASGKRRKMFEETDEVRVLLAEPYPMSGRCGEIHQARLDMVLTRRVRRRERVSPPPTLLRFATRPKGRWCARFSDCAVDTKHRCADRLLIPEWYP